MADDHMPDFPEPAEPARDQTNSSGTAGETELNPEDYYRAYDARMELIYGIDQLKICGWLNIGYDSVTAEDLARATLSDDVRTQGPIRLLLCAPAVGYRPTCWQGTSSMLNTMCGR